MPAKKKNPKKNEGQAEQDPPKHPEEDETESNQNNENLEFLSSDQVLWFRNIIRAQGKDILNEMFQEKCRKLNEENESLKQWVKSETEGLLKTLTNYRKVRV